MNRGVHWNGSPAKNYIDYVNMGTNGNALDFGELTTSRNGTVGTSNGYRGLFGGGYPSTDTMDYVAIDTLGNAADYGNLSQARYYLAAISGD